MRSPLTNAAVLGALDAGLIFKPALVENQIVGQMIQSLSPILNEEVQFKPKDVTSLDWAPDPILRFATRLEMIPVV